MHFTDTYLPRRDGVITSLRVLRQALAEAGHQSVTVVPAHPGQDLAEPGLIRLKAVPCGVADLRLARWPVRKASQEIIGRLSGELPDLIHVHSPGPTGLLGVLAAQELGVPLVQTYHTDLHAYADAYRVPAWALRLLARLYAHRLQVPGGLGEPCRTRRAALDSGNRLLLGPADAVILPTPAILDRVQLPVPESRVYLVPTGVAAVPPAEGFAERFGLAETDRVVLFVGRVNREKGIELLVPAFARVLRAEPRAVLVLIGAVYEPRWLRRLIAEAGIGDRVILTGQLPPEQVAAAYQQAEVFAFPSLTDTQALVLQEAALAGVPTVMADPLLHARGALAGEAVLARPEVEPFADAVIDLLASPEARRALGRRAAAAADRHSPAGYAAAMLDIYRRVTLGPGRLMACGRTRRGTPAGSDQAYRAA